MVKNPANYKLVPYTDIEKTQHLTNIMKQPIEGTKWNKRILRIYSS